ncbi:DJ-1/PfpI/YhbO family deglycase/protease [Achromobacter xylosoxidans]|uniref:DJ-1/PfpI domain-containing protein n=1 Tax=Alcaligenes xylosoxydans xylosoxydans TaxID=85698 RepID=A0A1R1K0A2_ALCXX|nr:DJ-1/PfpI/YhbO family deglycase/protease [Achromobacter xylosoxidans]OMG92648.1 hypothetical protein BIZ92_08255 [Achromobacter xylosoxidans]BEG75471.1 Putative cysteine protease YraA [Achromobacter xylosoxidans]
MAACNNALIVAGRAIQDHEFIYPYYRLQEAGLNVDVAVRGKETVYGSIGVKVSPDIDIADIDINKYSVLIIPGGAKAMEYMRQDTELLRTIHRAHNGGLVIASICHGAQLLISADLVRGRRISGYYSIKDDINNAGGHYLDEPVVIDGQIVTTSHYKYLGAWMAGTLTTMRQISQQACSSHWGN